MKIELYEKLQQLKFVLRQLDLSARLAIVEQVRAQLPPEALTTRDGQHAFSAENLLVIALCAPHCANKDELVSICGLYQGGYQSELRRCAYHNWDSHQTWKTELTRLYYFMKKHVQVEFPVPSAPQHEVKIPREDYQYAYDDWKESKFV